MSMTTHAGRKRASCRFRGGQDLSVKNVVGIVCTSSFASLYVVLANQEPERQLQV